MIGLAKTSAHARHSKILTMIMLVMLLGASSLPAEQSNSLQSKPAVGRNADGQLVIFEVDTDGRLRQRFRNKLNGDWLSWSDLGGAVLPDLALVNGADGRLVVFAVDRNSHQLQCLAQRVTNSLEWTAWRNLGGNILPPIAAAQNLDGRLEVFAVAFGSNATEHIWQTGADDSWSSWSDLGGAAQPGLLATKNLDGRLELFGIEDGGHALIHCWQQQANNDHDWSGWTSLGGAIQPGFAAGENAVGRLEIFAVDFTNDTVVRMCQTIPGDSERWTAWQDFGTVTNADLSSPTRDSSSKRQSSGDPVRPALVVGKSGDGRLEVFAVKAKDGNLLHRWETLVNGADQWSQWSNLGLIAKSSPAVGMNEDGDLEVFAVDAANQDVIHHRRQISSASDWLDWSTLDHRTFPSYSRTWQLDEGLPDNFVQAITQTTDGFLWAGTREGLARFDGDHFVSYNAQNTPAFKNSSVTALCADQNGALWIGTDGGGLLRLKTGSFTPFSEATGLAGDAVRVIYQSHDGTVWIGTTTGMSRWQNGKLSTYGERDGLLSAVVRSLNEDREGNLWIATGKGLNRLRRNGVMDAFAMPNGLPDDSVRAICQDRGGRIWIGSNNGLLWYNWFWENNFYAYNTKYGLSDTFVSAICEDDNGELWVGTYSGLNRFRDGRFYSQPDDDGQPFDKVNALFLDRQGDLWVGSQQGLSRLRQQKFFTYSRQQGLTHNNIMSVLQDRTGSMWAGTWGGGLDKLQNEQVTAYASTNGLPQDLILSLCAGRDGSLWAGAGFEGGLMHLKDGRLTRYTWKDGLINASLRVLHEDPQGNLWIGTDRGMSCFRNGKFVTNEVTASLAGVSIRDICEDSSFVLWFATGNGLVCWQGRQLLHLADRDGLSGQSLTALFMDENGTLWIGTSGDGLIRRRNGSFTTYGTRQGLYSDDIQGIIGDDQGWLWMTCPTGVFRVQKGDFDHFDQGRPEGLVSVSYGKSDGLKSPQCNGNGKPSVWKSGDGRLWFPTTKGLVVADPRTVGVDDKPPTAIIETVMADAKMIENGQTNLAGSTTVLASQQGPAKVPPGHGELEFHYSVLDFSAPKKERFQYRLEGVDHGWVDAGTLRVAHYNSLLPGHYRFQVRACNQDGIWNNVGTTLDLILLPHYWQTIWFRAMLAVAVMGVIAGLVLQLGRRRVQRELQVFEQQHALEKERGRIAKDVHDQIGAGLTQLGLLGELARRDDKKTGESRLHAEKICGLARELAQALDEIVWTVNPRNDTLNKLAAYLAAYAEEFFQGSEVRCRLDIPTGLPAYPLSAELRHNLFLTVKEALNNIVKHSRATEADLRLALSQTGLEVVVLDNGTGMTLPDGSPARNGLSNMRERIAEIGGRIEISRNPCGGTRIRLWIPLKGGTGGNGG